MVAVHQHFGLDDGNDIVLLTQSGIAGQRVCIGVDRIVAGDARRDVDHRAPFRKARAQLVVLRQTFAQTIQPFGDGVAGAAGQRLGALVHLDTGNRTGIGNQLDQSCAVFCLLTDGFIKQDDTGNVFAHRIGRAKQKLAIIAAVVLGVFHIDGIKAFFDRGGGFIGGKNAFALCRHRVRCCFQFCEIHVGLFSLGLFEGSNARQFLTFQPFQKCPTSGGDIGEIIADTGMIEGCHRVAAARHRKQIA